MDGNLSFLIIISYHSIMGQATSNVFEGGVLEKHLSSLSLLTPQCVLYAVMEMYVYDTYHSHLPHFNAIIRWVLSSREIYSLCGLGTLGLLGEWSISYVDGISEEEGKAKKASYITGRTDEGFCFCPGGYSLLLRIIVSTRSPPQLACFYYYFKKISPPCKRKE